MSVASGVSQTGYEAAVGAYRERFEERERSYVIRDNDILAFQAANESNARSYPRRTPVVFRRGAGAFIEDIEGRVFIDCLSGAGSLVLGHAHPVIKEAIRRELDDGVPMQTLDLATVAKHHYMHDILGVLPPTMREGVRIQFCSPSGSDAVEAALKLVRTATGRSDIISFRGAYHGMTMGSLGLMGDVRAKARLTTGAAVHFAPFPYPYRCPFGVGGEMGEALCYEYLASMLSDERSGVARPAGIILELIQGEGGVVPAPFTWVRQVRALAKALAIPFIIDEIQTGIARTGKMFAFEHYGLDPDVVVLSKAIGGGLPIAVMVYDAALDAWQPGAHAGTFRGSQLSMASGSAALRYVKENELWLNAQAVGERIAKRLRRLQQANNVVGDVRGKGLMVGIEIVDSRSPTDKNRARPASRHLATAIQRRCLELGLLVELGGWGGAVIRLLPPLIIDAGNADDICSIIEAAVSQVSEAYVRSAVESVV